MDILHDSPVLVDQSSGAAGSSADHQTQTTRPSSPRARPLDVCSGESAPSPSFPPAFQPRAARSFVGTLASALEPLQPEDGASVDPIMPMLHHAHQPVPAGICSWWRHAQQESQTMLQQGHYESHPPLGVEREEVSVSSDERTKARGVLRRRPRELRVVETLGARDTQRERREVRRLERSAKRVSMQGPLGDGPRRWWRGSWHDKPEVPGSRPSGFTVEG